MSDIDNLLREVESQLPEVYIPGRSYGDAITHLALIVKSLGQAVQEMRQEQVDAATAEMERNMGDNQ